MKTQAERKSRRENRRRVLRESISATFRPLDDDDREALTSLIRTAVEILDDGDVSAEEWIEMRELIDAAIEARANTPARDTRDDLHGLAEREQG